jgi:DnaJ-class molecular chaperone
MLTPPIEQTDTLPDYYALLGVARDAPLDAIQQRYRFWVTALHPARFALDPEMTQQAEQMQAQAAAAYATLAEAEQRAAYDAQLAAADEARAAPARAAEREVQRLRGELAQRETALAAQQATQAGVEQRLAEVERKAAWDRQELAGLVTAAERKATRLQAKSEAEARTNQRSRRNLRLWQAAAIVGIVNTVVLLWLLLAR